MHQAIGLPWHCCGKRNPTARPPPDGFAELLDSV